ncbi:MAG: carbonic anhydrase family protein [Isosphaeraceae bacterium]
MMNLKAKLSSCQLTWKRQRYWPSIDGLEPRHLLSTAHGHAHPLQASSIVGTISGEVVNDKTGLGMSGIRVQLINSVGHITEMTTSNRYGDYSLGVPSDGAYVVRELVPGGWTQTSPTFVSDAPTGSYLPGYGNSSWNYTSTNTDPTKGVVGPAGWGNLTTVDGDPFGAPVNITRPAIDLSKVVTVNYAPAVPKQIINNSHQIQAQFNSSTADTVTLGGQVFSLTQFHYHDPSENTVHGRKARMEEHFVNVSASGAETVVAVFLQLGAHNYALDPVLNAASTSLTSPNSSTTITTPIDFAGLLPKSTRGWFYQGSLTTPPLSQPVNWFVYATPITLDAKQLAEYQTVASGSGFLPNARPVQPLDGRIVNEINYDVNFTGTNLTLNYGIAPPAPKSV